MLQDLFKPFRRQREKNETVAPPPAPLGMIPYIGDVSRQDAEVLKEFAINSENMLEFGCGASTQILSCYAKPDARLTSLDTTQEWIEKTKQNLALYKTSISVDFHDYETFMKEIPDYYDFIFNDGFRDLREAFAHGIWWHLRVGGYMAFHDTRRGPEFQNVLSVLKAYQSEIGTVEFNYRDSNITVVQKVPSKVWYNWNEKEGRKPWMVGYGNPDLQWLKDNPTI